LVDDPSIGVLTVSYEIQANSSSEVMHVNLNSTSLFSYELVDGVLKSVKDSGDELIISYDYDESGYLSEVTYADGNERLFNYINIGFLKLLSGITDERGIQYAIWTYDAKGRAISSEHAGGAERTLLEFNVDGSTTVTNSLNKKTIYHFATIAGAKRVTTVEGVPTENCIGANQSYTYSQEGWTTSKTNWKGVKDTYSYNILGQEISRTEAFGTPEARTVITEWHPIFYLKTKITEPNRETVYSYDANGLLLNQTSSSLVAQ